MDVILGWLPWGGKAFPFHGPVNWDEAGGHRSKLKVVLAYPDKTIVVMYL